jgi:predicted dehydrogenase
MASAILDFGNGTSTFTCSTQLAPFQRVNLFGNNGRIEIEIPFNPPANHETRIWHQRGNAVETITLPACNQYTIQGDAFARCILDDTPVPTPIDDAIRNMRVIEAIRLSAETATWQQV